MRLPDPRGPVSAALVAALGSPVGSEVPTPPLRTADPLRDEDLQLGLTVLYELHYRGFENVDERWEWDPALLAARARLEAAFEHGLRDQLSALPEVDVSELPAALFELAGDGKRPALASHLARHGTVEQYRELLTHRSLYHLREADPHTWAIPRLDGPAKAALVEVQVDEYGGGRAERMHATLFATTMRELGLDDRYGAHLDLVPATTLAPLNLMSLFGLHRRLRGALVGHLAALEMTSCQPNRLYGNGLRRLGYGPDATRFYDEHVEADAVHEQVAGRTLAGSLVAAEPRLVPDVLFGAAACLSLDDVAGEHLLASWHAGRSSLRSAVVARTGAA